MEEVFMCAKHKEEGREDGPVADEELRPPMTLAEAVEFALSDEGQPDDAYEIVYCTNCERHHHLPHCSLF